MSRAAALAGQGSAACPTLARISAEHRTLMLARVEARARDDAAARDKGRRGILKHTQGVCGGASRPRILKTCAGRLDVPPRAWLRGQDIRTTPEMRRIATLHPWLRRIPAESGPADIRQLHELGTALSLVHLQQQRRL